MALKGIRVLEIAGLAPAPFAGMILADFGADVIRIDRPNVKTTMDRLGRGKRSVAIDFKNRAGIELFKRMADRADVLIEPFRPGVMEKLGLGPEVLCKTNPRLIYARLTGYGQTGPYAHMAGHDVNYLALSGALAAIGREGENPIFPVNLLADFAGGGMLCALGVLIALLERDRISGKGQVLDVAMMDGATYLSTFLYKLRELGAWSDKTGTNLLDTGAHFYEVYRTKDNKFVSVGAIEPQFYSKLIEGMGLDPASLPPQMDQSHWPEMKKKFAAVFASKTRDEWQSIFDGTDACVAPVLSMVDADRHPHVKHRGTLLRSCDMGASGEDAAVEPAPAPRLSRTPAVTRTRPQPSPGQHTVEVLLEFGFSQEEIEQATKQGIIISTKLQSAL